MKGVLMEWLVPQRVALTTVPGHLSAPALQDIDEWLLTHLAAATAPLHVIGDARQLQRYPPLHAHLNQKSVRHPRVGWLVMIEARYDPVRWFVMSTMVRAARVPLRFTYSPEEALMFLQAQDATLPDLKAAWQGRSAIS